MYNFVPISTICKSKNRRTIVVAISPDGKKHRFTSIREAGRQLDIPSSNIVGCLKGRLKTAGGYRWKYAKE